MSETIGRYVWGDPPDGDDAYLGDVFVEMGEAVHDCVEHMNGAGCEDEVQYVYRLVPVKIVRRAGVIVEDVS